MKTLKNLLRSGLFIATFLTFAGIAHATDYTVTTLTDSAGDGTCDVTECTLREAIDDASTDGTGPNQVLFDATLSGGTIEIQGDYISIEGNTAEFTIFANNNVTISSNNNGVIFGVSSNVGNVTIDGLNFLNGALVLASGTTSTITTQNCTFNYDAQDLLTRQTTINAGGNTTIQDNDFTNTNNAITAAGGTTIQRNNFTDSYGDIVISVTYESQVYDNVIHINNEYTDGAWGAISLTSGEGTINVTGNEIYSTDTDSEDKPTRGIFIRDLTNTATFNISDNIILPDSDSKKMNTCIYSEGGSNMTIENNICNFDDHAIYFAGNNSTLSNVSIDHNTLFRGLTGTTGDGISFNDIDGGVLTTSNITITNNIISALNLEATLSQGITDNTGTATPTNDYNLIYNATANTDITLGSHLVESYPAFVDYDDFVLAPFSAAIGTASDGSDLGAVDYTGETRRTTIYVDDDGTIDYATVDLNEIQQAIESAVDGDTILVAAGTYDAPIQIDSKELTITGADKATTILEATDQGYGIKFLNADNSTVSGFTVQNSEAEGTLTAPVHAYDYAGNTYNKTSGVDIGFYFAHTKSSPANAGTDLQTFSEDTYSVTTSLALYETNWNLALCVISGEYMPIYFSDAEFPDQATATEWLLEIDATATIPYWKDNAFTYTANSFTFDSSTIGGATGVTLTSGSPTPDIDLVIDGGSLYLDDSSSNSISDMNITNNEIGVYFTGDSLTNIVLNVIFTNSTTCDTYSDATGDNTVNGVTISGTGCNEEEEPGDTTSPVGLTALTSSARTTSSVTLNWSQVTEANFGHYEIWYGTDTSAVSARTASEWDADNDATLATISTTSTTIPGLSSSTQYYFKIWAVDTSSNEETVEALSVTTSNEGGGGGNVITDDDEPDEVVINGPPTNPEFTDTIQEILDDAEEDAINDAADDLGTLQDLIDAADELTENETIEDIAQVFDLPLTSVADDIIDAAREVLDNAGDADGDGISNIEETLRGLDPFRAEDSDNDGIPNFADPNPIDPSDFETPELIANPDNFVFGTDNKDPLTLTTGRLEMAIVSDQGLVLSGTAKPNEEVIITTRSSGNGSIKIKTKADKNGRFIIAGELEGLNLGENSILAIQAENSDGYKKSILAKTRLETIDQPKIEFTGGNVKAVSELDSKTVQGVIAGTLEMPKLWTDIVNEKVKEYIATTEYNKYFVEVVAAAKERALGSNKMIVQGHAKPGSTVIIAFKSVTFSSVVIADKNGYFESEVPQELVEELAAKKNVTDDLHQFIAFSVDYKSNKVSPFVQGLFKIYK